MPRRNLFTPSTFVLAFFVAAVTFELFSPHGGTMTASSDHHHVAPSEFGIFGDVIQVMTATNSQAPGYQKSLARTTALPSSPKTGEVDNEGGGSASVGEWEGVIHRPPSPLRNAPPDNPETRDPR